MQTFSKSKYINIKLNKCKGMFLILNYNISLLRRNEEIAFHHLC